MHFNFSSGENQLRGQRKRKTSWGILPLFVIGLFLSSAGVYGFRAYARILEARPMLDVSVAGVKPESVLGVTFPSSVDVDGFADAVRLVPDTPVVFEWTNDDRKLLVKPVGHWLSGTRYSLLLPAGKTVWLGSIPETKLFFETWAPPKVESVSPSDGARDVLLGAEDPVVVHLDRSAEDSFLDFSFNGEKAVVYGIDSDKQEFRILPRDTQSGVKYSLIVRVRHRESSDASFETAYEGSFETLPPAPTVMAADFPTRLLNAKRYTVPVVATGKYIDINVETQVMTIFEDGKAVDAYMVSSGKRGMDTPKGNYTIHNKAPRPWSKAYGLYMPYWMALVASGKYGIHELPEWPGGYKEGANHLGTPVSHGCVRLGVGPAERVYNWADIGTPVTVH